MSIVTIYFYNLTFPEEVICNSTRILNENKNGKNNSTDRHTPKHRFHLHCGYRNMIINQVSQNTNLSFWNNLDSHLLALQFSLLRLGRASIPKMPTPNLFSKLVLCEELLREAEALVQSLFNLAALRDGGLVRLHRSMPSGEQGLDVLRRRWRRERPLEDPERGRVDAGIDRGALVRARQRAWDVEGELGLLRGPGIRRRGLLNFGHCRDFFPVVRILDRFSMADTHRNQNPVRGTKKVPDFGNNEQKKNLRI